MFIFKHCINIELGDIRFSYIKINKIKNLHKKTHLFINHKPTTISIFKNMTVVMQLF